MHRPEIEPIVQAVRSVVGASEVPIPLHEPTFAGNEWKYLKECLESTYVSSTAPPKCNFIARFERMVAQATGAAHAVAVVNGTAGLHVCLKLAGVGPGDEVIVPSLTFVATANAVTYCGATPHFADISAATLGLDPEQLAAHLAAISEIRADGRYDVRTGQRIAAIIPMHAFGLPVDLEAFHAVSQRFSIPLVEDIAQALGSTYRGRGIAASTRLGALSFNGNKIVTTGGGGAVVTNDTELANRARHITTTARVPHDWAFEHDEIGFNYRMPNLNAALGCGQLDALPKLLQAKRILAERYSRAFAGIDGVNIVAEPNYGTSNHWLNAILLDDDTTATRDAVLAATHAAGLITRPAWTLMHKLPMYRECPRADLSVSESVERQLITLPSSAHLSERL